MSFKVSEEAIELTYTEQAFSEIPNLLFGTATDGTHYFDATYKFYNIFLYISTAVLKISVLVL